MQSVLDSKGIADLDKLNTELNAWRDQNHERVLRILNTPPPKRQQN